MRTEPRRWSYSALEDYLGCGERFRLKRIQKVPRAVYFNAIGGSAFHEWSADRDLGRAEVDEWPAYLEAATDEAVEKSHVPLEKMRFSGPNDNTPVKETYEHWRDVLGPQLIDKWLNWTKDRQLVDDLPPDENGNTVGVEYKLNFTIGTTAMVATVDRFYEWEGGTILALDIKAGARKQNTVQVPTYVFGARKLGIDVKFGSLYYARKGMNTKPKDYSKWDERRLAFLYEQAAAMEARGFYLPRPSDDCGWCPVRMYCDFAL